MQGARRGGSPSAVLSELRGSYDVKLEALMPRLDEVRALYLTEFGEDRDLGEVADDACGAGGLLGSGPQPA